MRRPHKLTDPETRARAFADYDAGDGLRAVADRYHVLPRILRRELEASGRQVRTKSEQCRLQALWQHDSPLRQISRDRWHELYWGEEQPSLKTLAWRLSEIAGHPVSVRHVRRVLADLGFEIRSAAQQLRIDGEKGRRAGLHYYWPSRLSPEQYRAYCLSLSEAGKKAAAKRTPAWNAKLGQAHRQQETRLCAWCAAPVTRIPCRFRQPPERTGCNRSCANQLSAWRRRFGDAPRPLIVARLQELLASGPLTYERALRQAEQCGAGEAEIEAVLLPD